MNASQLRRLYSRMQQDRSSRRCSRCDQVRLGSQFRLQSRVCDVCRSRRRREDPTLVRKRRDYQRLESTKERRRELEAARKAEERQRDELSRSKTCRSCKAKKPWSYFEPHEQGVYGLGSVCSNCRKEVK